MKVIYPLSVLFSLFVLTSCGNDNKLQVPLKPSQPTVSHTARVAAGFSNGEAIACIDKNLDKKCADDELRADIDTDGYFTFTDVTQSTIDNHPIVAQITVSILDNKTHELKPIQITTVAPAGYNFLSPYSLLVQYYIEQGDDLAVAEQKVKDLTVSDIHPNDDYLAKQIDDSLTTDEKKIYLKQHALAHIWHALQAMNMDISNVHIESQQLTHKQQMELVITGMTQAMPDIKSAGNRFYHNGLDFSNPFNQLNNKTKRSTLIDFTHAQEQLIHISNQKSSTPVDLQQIYIDNDAHRFSTHQTDSVRTLKFSSESLNSETKLLSRHAHVLNDGVFSASLQSEKEPFMFYSNGGWVHPNSSFKMESVNEDNSIIMVNTQHSGLKQIHSASQYSLANVKTQVPFISSSPNSTWKNSIEPNARFDSQAKGIELSKVSGSDIFTQQLLPGCILPNIQPHEECFVPLPTYFAGELSYEVNGIDDLFTITPSDGEINVIKGPIAAINAGQYIVAELNRTSPEQSSGTVLYYLIKPFSVDIDVETGIPSYTLTKQSTLFDRGTWQLQDPESQTPLYTIPLPDDVFTFNHYKYIKKQFVITEQNGVAAIATMISANEPVQVEKVTMNAPARNVVLQNTNANTLPKLPALDTILHDCNKYDQISLQVLNGLSIDDQSLNNSAIGIALKYAKQSTVADYFLAYYGCSVQLPETNLPHFDPREKDFVAADHNRNIDQVISFNEDNTGSLLAYYQSEVQTTPVTPFRVDFTWKQIANTQIELTLLNSNPEKESHINIGIRNIDDNVISTQLFFEGTIIPKMNEPAEAKGYISSQLYLVIDKTN